MAGFVTLGMLLLLLGLPVLGGQNAVEKIPDTIKVVYQRAVWEAKLGRLDHAVALFNKITKDYPSISNAYTNLGLLHLSQNDLSAAEQALQKAVELNSTDAIAHNHLGVVYRKLGKFRKAEQVYLKCLELNSRYADARLNLAILYDLYLHDMANALANYRQYQLIQNQEDNRVGKWIVDVERRLAKQHKQVNREQNANSTSVSEQAIYSVN